MVLGSGLRTASAGHGEGRGRHSRGPFGMPVPVRTARPPPMLRRLLASFAVVLWTRTLSISNRRREVSYESQQMGLRAYLVVGPQSKAG